MWLALELDRQSRWAAPSRKEYHQKAVMSNLIRSDHRDRMQHFQLREPYLSNQCILWDCCLKILTKLGHIRFSIFSLSLEIKEEILDSYSIIPQEQILHKVVSMWRICLSKAQRVQKCPITFTIWWFYFKFDINY